MDFIARHPEAGDIIPETGGVRKVRWRRDGMGKRGGVRVIHFYYDQDQPLYLMMIYAKSEREDVSSDQKRELRKMATEFKILARVRGSTR